MKSERYQEMEQRSNDTIEAGKGSRSRRRGTPRYAGIDRPRDSYMEILLIHVFIILLELRFKIDN